MESQSPHGWSPALQRVSVSVSSSLCWWAASSRSFVALEVRVLTARAGHAALREPQDLSKLGDHSDSVGHSFIEPLRNAGNDVRVKRSIKIFRNVTDVRCCQNVV